MALPPCSPAEENNVGLTSGGIGRSGRQIETSQLLRQRGIVSDFGRWGHQGRPTHDDPVVAVFAPDDMMGIHHDLADLFVVQYLAERPRPDGSTLTLNRGAEMLRESIDHQGQQASDNVVAPDDHDDDDDGDDDESGDGDEDREDPEREVGE